AQHGAEDERNEQEKSDAEHHRERKKTIANQSQPRASPLHSHAPDRVERFLQFAEDARCAKEQRRDAGESREDAGGFLARALPQNRLDCLGRLPAEEVLELPRQLAAGGFFSKNESDHRDDDDEQRREREDRIV